MGTFFSFGPGSSGDGNEIYSIRLPFSLAPGRTLKLEDASNFSLFGLPCHVSGGEREYLLTASGFTSEDAAVLFLQKTCAALIWYGLRHSAGIKFSPDIVPIEAFLEPKSVSENSMFDAVLKMRQWDQYDGHYECGKTSVIPEHKRLIQFAVGSATMRIDTPLASLAKTLEECNEIRHPERTVTHPKFRLACEVYLSSHFENSPGASFLSRISTLEILANDTPSPDPIRQMVTRFIAEAKSARDGEGSEELRQELQSLISRLAFLRHRSIKGRIQDLVRELLENELGAKDAAVAAKSVSQLYDLRSTMVHSGEVDATKIRDGNSKLIEIVPTLLRTIYRKLAE